MIRITTERLNTRAQDFGFLASAYDGLSQNEFIHEVERAVYEDVADLLNQIEDRFARGVIELDEQCSLPFPVLVGVVERV